MKESTNKSLKPKSKAPNSNIESEETVLKAMDVEAIKKKIAEEVKEQANIKEEEAGLFEKMLEEATMPVVLDDDEFKLGPSELDIRGLSKRNTNQMFFRTLVLQNVYLKQLLTASLDQIRLLMVICDKLGVVNISKATDEVARKERKLNNIKVGASEETPTEEKQEENKA